MSVRKSLSVVAAATSTLPSVASAEETLYENSAVAANQQVWAETNYSFPEGNQVYDYDTEVADDFVVPEGEGWSIERVFVDGQYDPPPAPYAGTLSFSIRTDDNGLPGAPVSNPRCTGTAVAPAITPPASLSYSLPKPCFLEPGHYWFAVGADTQDDGFFYAKVSARPAGAPASDLGIAVRSNCGLLFATNPALPPSFWALPVPFVEFQVPATPQCSPFNAAPVGYPNLALKFGLFGSLGAPPPEPDAGVDGGLADAGISDGGVADGGATDAGGTSDSGAQPDAEAPGDGDGDGEADGGTGELSGDGCDCSTTSSPDRGLGSLSLAGLVLWLVRRRKVKPAAAARNTLT